MFLAIVQHAPRWVWFLLAALLALGVSLSFPRRMSLRRAIVVPVAMVTLSLAGVVSAFAHTPLALVAWALGIAAALAATRALGLWRGIAWSAADARLVVPGSWLPLLMIVTLFAIKFCVGALLAMNPALAHDTGFAASAGLAYGAFSGLFFGRGVVMWQVARRNLQSALAV
jgi:uncharacterized membrane protein (DUF2068 family)